MLVVVVLLSAVVAYGFWGFSHDDAFITYRYADNLARGNGLVFNPDEPSLGTTAPGWATTLGALTAVAGWTGIGVAGWGTLLSVAAIVLIAWCVGAGARGSRDAWLAAALFGIVSLTLRWNVEMLGSEGIAMTGFVLLSGVLAFVAGRPVAGGAAMAAAIALRPDAGIAAAAVVGVLLASRRRVPWRYVLATLLPVGLWLLSLWFQLGDIFPDTLAAKQAGFAGAPYTAAQWDWLRRSLPLSGIATLMAAAGVGLVRVVREHAVEPALAAVVGLWLVGVEALYRLVDVPFSPWYHQPTLFVLIALGALGAVAVARWAATFVEQARRTGGTVGEGRRAPGPPESMSGTAGEAPRPSSTSGPAPPERRELPQDTVAPPRLLVVAVAALVVAPIVVPSVGWITASWRRPPDPRYRSYAEAGRWLRENTASGARVAAVEIGILGYFADRHVIDLMGLVTPEALEARRAGELGELVLRQHATHLVDNPTFHREALEGVLANPRIGRLYAPLARIHEPPYSPIVIASVRDR